MKEKLYTIEITDALKAGDECAFCYLERKLEQNTLSFVLGSSYMESDVRGQTDKQGFCRAHTKMMFQYGNQLGNAWILKTRFQYMNQELVKQMEGYSAPKASLFGRMKKTEESASSLSRWMHSQEGSCYVCTRLSETYERMINTFVYMVQKDKDFIGLLDGSKGFCMHHFADILDACEQKLGEKERGEILPVLFRVMRKNLDRLQEDINWFVEKNDYLNADADWKNSKDAVQRTMQKLVGSYPADPPFKKE